MVKEDRSGWVAVAPEFSEQKKDPSRQIRAASSAYQIFQRDVTAEVKEEEFRDGRPFDVGQFSRAVRDRWNRIDPVRKSYYEELARDDAARFAKESHEADVAQMERVRQRQLERDQLVFAEGDGRNTRRNRRQQQLQQQQKMDESSSKGDRKKRSKKQKKSKQQKKARKKSDSDESEFDESDESSDEDDEDEISYGSDDSDDKPRKKRAPPPPARKVSEVEAARREKLKSEKESKEMYIAHRQEDLRKERSNQAKRRLEFLLKQSDIFSHFGNVKEETAQTRVSAKATEKVRADRRTNDEKAAEGMDAADLEEEQATTYLTSQPTTLGFGKMRDYQLEGLNWMIRLQENGVNGILADEMGLGKTLQSISVLVYMMEYQHVDGPHLIVVPKSTLSNWMNELTRWAPTLKAVKFHGTKDERMELTQNVMEPAQRDENRTWNVCVTTYEVCNLDRNVLNKFAWSYLIIDEAHRLKNEASTFSKTIRTYETRYRLLLTGTPLQNNLHELWALLNFLVPDVFANAEQFDEWFNLDIEDADEKNKLISQLHKILRPFMLRRLKADVETSLPPKHETILFTGMSALQKKIYREILLRDFGVVQGQGGGSGSRTALLNIVMQLRKCAGHPYLFPGVEDRTLPPLGDHLVDNCGKMVLLDKLLKRLRERGHRVLLFTQMTRILDIMEDYLVMRQFPYCRIDGNTTYELREEYIDAYNAPNSEKFLFLLSTRAGGLGINLQTADVVILYDSDWNPQADLQAQDRAHRIGQKREVQVFRIVTENTIEEKIVERAQQKLKLDAMVVQQGRLKEKDKMSREELLQAVRFGADKIFKSKDSSITDDDIDLIMDAGKRKTQELNEKLQNADKGDLLDFKLDGGGLSTQTFEGVNYARAVQAQAQADLLGIVDIGKRERKPVANYNESQLYQQQIAALQGAPKKAKRKDPKLPKYLRLPRMEEWQMFDRPALQKIQEEEEKAFKALPEEQQKLASGKVSPQERAEEQKGDEAEHAENSFVLPPLLDEAKQAYKKQLLSEGFADWGRHHFTAFTRASNKHGRDSLEKIAIEVGKPLEAVRDYAKAFWSENIGKARFSEHEYERVVKFIEKGEKKMEDVKGIVRSTRVLVSLFDNPWTQLEFTYTSCRDKMFTMDEDRHLLCWAHKFGYGQWEAIRMAIRRNPTFRFDYFFRSLPTDLIGRRCEQLMKAAEKEVEQLEKRYLEEAGLPADSSPVVLPNFKTIRSQMRKKAKQEADTQLKELEGKVEEIEDQMRRVQQRLKELNEFTRESTMSSNSIGSDFPDELVPELASLLVRSSAAAMLAVANAFSLEHPGRASKKLICSKIEEIAVKESREDEGDTDPIWYIRQECMHLLDADTLKYIRQAKEEKQRQKAKLDASGPEEEDEEAGAPGPDGNFLKFPEYDGSEPPKVSKKAFTHFCNGTRREVKQSLPAEERRNKEKINSILKDTWLGLSEEDRVKWKKWEIWDEKRFERDQRIYDNNAAQSEASASKKRDRSDDVDGNQNAAKISQHVPKKKRG